MELGNVGDIQWGGSIISKLMYANEMIWEKVKNRNYTTYPRMVLCDDTDGGIAYSFDEGQTWSKTNVTYIRDVRFIHDKYFGYNVNDFNRLYYSYDSITWTETSIDSRWYTRTHSGSKGMLVDFEPSFEKTYKAGYANGVYYYICYYYCDCLEVMALEGVREGYMLYYSYDGISWSYYTFFYEALTNLEGTGQSGYNPMAIGVTKEGERIWFVDPATGKIGSYVMNDTLSDIGADYTIHSTYFYDAEADWNPYIYDDFVCLSWQDENNYYISDYYYIYRSEDLETWEKLERGYYLSSQSWMNTRALAREEAANDPCIANENYGVLWVSNGYNSGSRSYYIDYVDGKSIAYEFGTMRGATFNGGSLYYDCYNYDTTSNCLYKVNFTTGEKELINQALPYAGTLTCGN